MSSLKVILPKENFLDHREAVVEVYRETFSQPPYSEPENNIQLFAEKWPERTTNPQFKLVLVEKDGETIGMAYGWKSIPGSKWTEKMAGFLGDDAKEWMEDCFEFADIAVKPSAQGLGAGKVLYKSLFEDINCKTSLLFTHQSNSVAHQMYLKLGWEELRKDLKLESGKSFYMMGKRF